MTSAARTADWSSDMDAYFVSDLIDQIRATSARTEKEKLVEKLAGSEMGRFVLYWAYNPFVTYGLKPLKKGESAAMNLPFKEVYIKPLLEKLSSRELTGNAAEREVGETMNALDDIGANLLFLILSKDLKCGIGINTIQCVMPGLVPSYSVMRANKYVEGRMKSGKRYKGEYKLDGQRNTFLCKDGNGGFFTRSGRRVPQLDFMVPAIINASKLVANSNVRLRKTLIDANGGLSFMLDGEAMMGLFKNTGKLRRKGEQADGVELHLYDILSYDDFNVDGPAGPIFEERRALLVEFAKEAAKILHGTKFSDLIQVGPQFFINSHEEAMAIFDASQNMTLAKYLARGDTEREKELLKETIDEATGAPKILEGVVVKDLDAQYEKRKTNAWMKIKPEETKDLRITGAYIGKEHTELENTLGGIQVMNGDVPVNVGGGYMRDARDEIWALWLEDLENGAMTLSSVANGKKRIDYEPNPGYEPKLVGRLLEVKYMEETPDGSLRHPNAIRFRDDKDGETD